MLHLDKIESVIGMVLAWIWFENYFRISCAELIASKLISIKVDLN